MKILVVSESPLEKIGSKYYAADPWIRIPLNLAEQDNAVTVWAPLRCSAQGAAPKGRWELPADRLLIEPLDYYNSFSSYYRLWPRRRRRWASQARDMMARHDIVIMRVPSPILPIVARNVPERGCPLILFIVGDIATQSDALLSSSGVKRLVYRFALKMILRSEIAAGAKAALVYAYNQDIARRHGAPRAGVKQIQDPHLRLADFFERVDTCLDREIRLLRVCWLLPSKGLEPLFESVALLARQGRDVRLEIIGKERVSGYQAQLERLAAGLGISARVSFSGWLPFDRTAQAFVRSDIQVLSSLAEGTPRVIVEGFARGLPLVSTNAGGCADFLSHEENALLVSPGDPPGLARAVERMIDDGALRRKLIANGYRMARSQTFEVLGQEILNDLRAVRDGGVPA